MQAKLKRLHSPDALDLESYVPSDPERFSLLIQMMVGPSDADGEESFDLVVCTAGWLKDRYEREGEIVLLRHHALVSRFDYSRLRDQIRTLVERCSGESWEQVAQQVGRIGKWEFDDYQEMPPRIRR